MSPLLKGLGTTWLPTGGPLLQFLAASRLAWCHQFTSTSQATASLHQIMARKRSCKGGRLHSWLRMSKSQVWFGSDWLALRMRVLDNCDCNEGKIHRPQLAQGSTPHARRSEWKLPGSHIQFHSLPLFYHSLPAGTSGGDSLHLHVFQILWNWSATV